MFLSASKYHKLLATFGSESGYDPVCEMWLPKIKSVISYTPVHYLCTVYFEKNQSKE